MYEQFGGLVDQAAKTVTFKLFVPDGNRCPSQYDGGGLPRLKDVFVVGSFQKPATREWDSDHPIKLIPTDFVDPDGSVLKGTVYTCTSGVLPHGFYEYKYLATFENAPARLITDPCARYGGTVNQNSGFVVGGAVETVDPLPIARRPLKDLIIYELMIDDFTAQKVKATGKAPLEAVVEYLDDLVALGINAIEFMPWTAWTYPDDPSKDDFSWGYNPVQYFSVAHKYTNNPSTETDKIVYLKRLISECHKRKLQVIMDGVFNHADASPPNRGFPYYWLYQDPADSPYVGNFAEHAFFQDLDYANRCTLEYIRDACDYWIDTFQIDGIRFDNTLGLYKPDDRGHGIPKLLSELRGHLSEKGIPNFAMILEHSWDYGAIDVVNKVGATSCWLDPYRSQSMSYLGDRPQGIPQIEPSIMRLLNSGRDFGPGRVPTIYIENHDHKRFMLKAGGRGDWPLTQPYIIALFTCAGATLIYNGQEWGADNDMPENGEGRVVPRPLDWDALKADVGPDVHARYQQMIQIRSEHPGLRSPHFYPNDWKDEWRLPDPQGFGIDRDRNVVVYHRWAEDDNGHVTDRYYIALNFSQKTQPFSFEVAENGNWQELISGATVSVTSGRIETNIGSNWGAIYYKQA